MHANIQKNKDNLETEKYLFTFVILTCQLNIQIKYFFILCMSFSAVVSMLLTLKVAKLGDKSIDPTHFVPGSPEYQRLNYEATHAVRRETICFSFSIVYNSV